jgi:C4-dicarboxylate-specific signal transduction histidine kinase
MRKARIPLPVLILISATLFLFASSFGEWIARPATSVRAPHRENVEEQQTAIAYVRVMSWLSQLVTRSTVRAQTNVESAQPADCDQTSTRDMATHTVQLCALSKPARPSRSSCKSSRWQLTIQNSPRSLARFFNEQRTTNN